MRKLLTLAIALVAALACLTDCSSDTEEEIAEKNENKYTFDFTFTKEVAETEIETRAVKSAWTHGDKVFVFFQNWTDGYLEFTYSRSTRNWSVAEKAFSGGTPSSPDLIDGGRCIGIWVDGNSLDPSDPASVSDQITTVNFPLKEMLVSYGGKEDYKICGGTVGGVRYTISGNNVSGRMSLQQHPFYTKVTATGLNPRKTWCFKIESAPVVAYKPQLEITPNDLTLKTKDMGFADGFIPAVKNPGEDHYFFYNTALYTKQATTRDERFIIRNDAPDMQYLGKTYNIAMGNHRGQAIKINCESGWNEIDLPGDADVNSNWNDEWEEMK